MKKIFLVLVVLMLVATLFISGCTDIDLSKNPFDDIDDTEDNDEDNTVQSEIKITGGLIDNQMAGASFHRFYFNSQNIISKIDKLDVKINCNVPVTCVIEDTRYIVGATYKYVTSATLTDINNPHGEWRTFDFPDSNLEPNVKYCMVFKTTDKGYDGIEHIILRKGDNVLTHRIWGWKI